jgi:glycosyltransferase involved in cell wall biosynthesis
MTVWPWTPEGARLPSVREDGSKWPRISIVTPSFNQGRFLEQTIRSVLLQQYPNLDYIVIDGGSTDESVAIIQKYAPWLSHWVSERDRGQAHAINKGLALATGEIFNWINSDDYLALGTLAVIARSFIDCDMVAGGNVIFGEGMPDNPRHTRGLTARSLLRRDPSSELHQMAMWVRRDHAVSCGGMDEEMHHAFDPDFFIRYLYAFPRVRYVEEMLGWYRKHDAAKTVALRHHFLPERLHTVQKIRRNPEFFALREDADYAELKYSWWLRLADIVNDPDEGRFRRALRILLNSRFDPDVRWDRVTRSAVKRLLKGDEIRPFTPVL